MQKALSLIELVFAILILGILAGIALPYFHTSTKEAKLLKLRAELDMVRSGIALARNDNLLRQRDFYPKVLDECKINQENEKLFSCSREMIANCPDDGVCCANDILIRGIKSSKRAWMKIGVNKYRFALSKNVSLDFEYDDLDGGFECVGKGCKHYGF